MLNKIANLEAKIKKDPFADLPKSFNIFRNRADNWGQLIHLRDAWRQGWVPVKEPVNGRWCIQWNYSKKCWGADNWHSHSHSALSFPDKETAERFLQQFEPLINECKDLLT
ncbi:MAG: hypothetical protein ACOCWC_04860 [Bacteroidota bacterium]